MPPIPTEQCSSQELQFHGPADAKAKAARQKRARARQGRGDGGDDDDDARGLLAAYFTEDQLAKELKVTPRTLWRWRRQRTGPPCTRLGGGEHGFGKVLYLKESVRKWLAGREQPMPRSNRRRTAATPIG